MTAEQLTKILSTKGQFRGMTVKRPAKLRAAFSGMNVQKRSSLTVQFGVQYENKKIVQEKRADGIEAVPLKNKGWEYVIYPYLVKTIKTGEMAVACNPIARNSTEWLLNGQVTDFSKIQHMLISSETSEKTAPEWMMVKLENVEEIR